MVLCQRVQISLQRTRLLRKLATVVRLIICHELLVPLPRSEAMEAVTCTPRHNFVCLKCLLLDMKSCEHWRPANYVTQKLAELARAGVCNVKRTASKATEVEAFSIISVVHVPARVC